MKKTTVLLGLIALIVLLNAYFTGFMMFDWTKLKDFALPSISLAGSWVIAMLYDGGSPP